MRLVQILLPLSDNEGRSFPRSLYDALFKELADRFGGVTAYTRSPAEGQWAKGRRTKREDVVVVEVMVDKADRVWWRELRQKLEADFRQDEVVVRAMRVKLL